MEEDRGYLGCSNTPASWKKIICAAAIDVLASPVPIDNEVSETLSKKNYTKSTVRDGMVHNKQLCQSWFFDISIEVSCLKMQFCTLQFIVQASFLWSCDVINSAEPSCEHWRVAHCHNLPKWSWTTELQSGTLEKNCNFHSEWGTIWWRNGKNTTIIDRFSTPTALLYNL